MRYSRQPDAGSKISRRPPYFSQKEHTALPAKTGKIADWRPTLRASPRSAPRHGQSIATEFLKATHLSPTPAFLPPKQTLLDKGAGGCEAKAQAELKTEQNSPFARV